MKNLSEWKLLKLFLPNYDWEKFEVAGYEIVNNEDKNSNKFYPERIIIKVQEKNIVPSELWSSLEYYSHWFAPAKKYQDYPARGFAVSIEEKRRRRKEKETGKIILLPQLDSPLESWTKAPSDLLYFLK